MSVESANTQVNQLADVFRRIQSGDSSAWTECYELTKNTVYYRLKLSNIPDREIEDLMQEIYIKIFDGIKNQKDPQTALKWINRIATNTAADHYRKSIVKNETLVTTKEDDEDVDDFFDREDDLMVPEKVMEDKDVQREVRQILHSLPENQYKTLAEFYFNERSITEIAEMRGVPEGTVKSDLSRGRKAFKEKVLDMEKKYGKLFAIAPVAFFGFIFAEEAYATTIPEAVSVSVSESLSRSSANYSMRNAHTGNAKINGNGKISTTGESISSAGQDAVKSGAEAATAVGKSKIILLVASVSAAAIAVGIAIWTASTIIPQMQTVSAGPAEETTEMVETEEVVQTELLEPVATMTQEEALIEAGKKARYEYYLGTIRKREEEQKAYFAAMDEMYSSEMNEITSSEMDEITSSEMDEIFSSEMNEVYSSEMNGATLPVVDEAELEHLVRQEADEIQIYVPKEWEGLPVIIYDYYTGEELARKTTTFVEWDDYRSNVANYPPGFYYDFSDYEEVLQNAEYSTYHIVLEK